MRARRANSFKWPSNGSSAVSRKVEVCKVNSKHASFTRTVWAALCGRCGVPKQWRWRYCEARSGDVLIIGGDCNEEMRRNDPVSRLLLGFWSGGQYRLHPGASAARADPGAGGQSLVQPVQANFLDFHPAIAYRGQQAVLEGLATSLVVQQGEAAKLLTGANRERRKFMTRYLNVSLTIRMPLSRYIMMYCQ
ncbi:hypothetical protein PBOI14_64740 [Pseudomonas sp. Boi14]|nr:hypothetical protein PBOI14_64740 [Pseudomonas sp. Boi14]